MSKTEVKGYKTYSDIGLTSSFTIRGLPYSRTQARCK